MDGIINNPNKINTDRKHQKTILVYMNKGFTLAEIMVVIIILGVLTTLALPRMTGTIERTRAAEGIQILTALLGAQKSFEFDNGSYATDPDVLDVAITNASYFNLPPTVADPADPVANPIASIVRTGSYTLCINELGVISCKNSGVFTCAQAGIANVCP